MRSQEPERTVNTQGVTGSVPFALSTKSQVHIMNILRNTLYTDKILAVLREYSSNAWDAHKSVGKDRVPIRVTLPTDMDPVLSIRDFGPGISRADAFEIYTQYGDSTKRENNNSVGMYGIGSKSGFCYSDSFTVSSWHAGVLSIYMAVLEQTGQGSFSLFHEEPCGDETGLRIQIPVRPKDIQEFKTKAVALFRHFDPVPEISPDTNLLPKENRTTLKSGYLCHAEGYDSPSRHGWVAVMGCVPYKVSIEQIKGPLTDIRMWGAVSSLSGGLFFDIGEVRISASREELEYSDETKQTLVTRFASLFREFADDTCKSLKSKKLSDWEKRLRVTTLTKKCGAVSFVLPEEWRHFLYANVRLKAEGHFTLRKKLSYRIRYSLQDDIQVDPLAFLAVKDVLKSDPRNYTLPASAIVVTPLGSKKEKQGIYAFLEHSLKEAQAEGIPIRKLSEFPYTGPAPTVAHQAAPKAVRSVSPKDRPLRYVLDAERLRTKDSGPNSAFWKGTDTPPSSDDVYAILNAFRYGNMFDLYLTDALLADYTKCPMPAVYGYRQTAQHPVNKAACLGTDYFTWRRAFQTRLAQDPAILRIQEDKAWGRILYEHATEKQAVVKVLVEMLGKEHPISVLFERHLAAVEQHKEIPKKVLHAISGLDFAEGVPAVKTAAQAKAEIQRQYPLLAEYGLDIFWDAGRRKAWLEYIRLMDLHRKDGTKDAVAYHAMDPDRRERDDYRGGSGKDLPEGNPELPDDPTGHRRVPDRGYPQAPDGGRHS